MKKLMKNPPNWVRSLKFLFKPGWWLMYGSYSEDWDRLLNRRLDQYKFTRQNDCIAILGRTGVWIANHPYGSFCPVHLQNIRPSRLTIERAHRRRIIDTLSDQ